MSTGLVFNTLDLVVGTPATMMAVHRALEDVFHIRDTCPSWKHRQLNVETPLQKRLQTLRNIRTLKIEIYFRFISFRVQHERFFFP